MRNTIIRPVITEKSMGLAKDKHYTFLVAPNAGKAEIRAAVAQAFGVDVLSVHTVRKAHKTRRVGRKRIPILIPVGKKAIVTVKKDQSIDLFELGEGKAA